jgi:signal transduction histidine kinase
MTRDALHLQGREIRLRLAMLVCLSTLPVVVCAVVLVWSLLASRDAAQGARGRVAAVWAALIVSVGVSLVAARAYAGRIEREVGEEIRSHQAEHELRQRAEAQKAAAEVAERNKDFFLAMVSHELRAPLTAVIGWLEIGRAHLAERGTVVRALDIALRNARQQARIMDDLLDVSRILSGHFAVEHRPVNLSRVAREALEAARPAAEERQVELALRIQEPLFVEGDRGRLLQAIGNLLGNGIKFNKAGGRVELALERSGERARVSVADDGVGIDAAALPHIFERYWQGEAAEALRRRGLGLGLALVRHIVELHGGEVRAESGGRGKGARFTLDLPLIVRLDTVAEDVHPAHTFAEARLNGLAVVAVDRNEDTLGWLQYVLALHGAMMWKAQNAEEALALAQREHADVQIADVADVDPGYSLVRALRAAPAQRHVAAVAFSSRPNAEECREALAAGYDSFVAKPCDANVLLRAVCLAAEGRGA